MTKAQRSEAEEARVRLLADLKPGSEVYCFLQHVTRSGMSRSIKLVIPLPREDGSTCLYDISWLASKATGLPLDRERGGVKVGGCGMDMGFALVYELSRALYPDGFDLPEGKQGRNGNPSRHESDGGYALDYRWL